VKHGMDVLRLRPADVRAGDYVFDSFDEKRRVSSVELDGRWAVIHAEHELAVIVDRDEEVKVVRER
jgi:hypothetical protein